MLEWIRELVAGLFVQTFPDPPELDALKVDQQEYPSINCPVLIEIDNAGHRVVQKGW